MIYFTADQHYNHDNIIRFCNRPFDSIGQMNECLINNHNSVVQQDDIIYMLGDVGFGNIKPILQRLNGQKILIIGSHDKGALQNKEMFKEVAPLIILKGTEYPNITLCHYAMRTWPRSHYNSWHLFGHSHGKLPAYGKSFDVGVDAHGFFPISIKQVAKIMENMDDNFNLVKLRLPNSALIKDKRNEKT